MESGRTASLSVGNMAAANKPEGLSAVVNHLDRMDTTLEGAHARMDDLVRRLEGVLRASAPNGAGGSASAPPQQIASPLAEKLRGHVVGVRALMDRINDVIERLDV
jgi:hypothetical protein